MFDLMAAIAGSEKQTFPADVAKVAKAAKPKAESEMPLAKLWLKVAKVESEIKDDQETGDSLARLATLASPHLLTMIF